VVVVADVVGAERAVVVGVGFVIGDRVELVKRLPPAGIEHAQQEFVLFGVVVLGLGKRHAVGIMVGQAHAIAVGLDSLVALAFFTGRIGADPREQSAGSVAGNLIRADGFFEPVPMMQDAHLDAVPILLVNAVRFPADVILHARRRHQVAF